METAKEKTKREADLKSSIIHYEALLKYRSESIFKSRSQSQRIQDLEELDKLHREYEKSLKSYISYLEQKK